MTPNFAKLASVKMEVNEMNPNEMVEVNEMNPNEMADNCRGMQVVAAPRPYRTKYVAKLRTLPVTEQPEP
jgi:hypothetical protein